MTTSNPHLGSDLDEWLIEAGIYDESRVEAEARVSKYSACPSVNPQPITIYDGLWKFSNKTKFTNSQKLKETDNDRTS